MTELKFRNIDSTPDQPVEDWGFEGLLAAIDRGSLTHWRRIAAAVRSDPWGSVARDLEEVVEVASDRGVALSLRRSLLGSRALAALSEREAVAAELSDLLSASGESQAEFAARCGTSRTRFNSYLNGRVVPSATFMVRARGRVARRKP